MAQLLCVESANLPLAVAETRPYSPSMTDGTGRWAIRSARTVYHNKWISVREYDAVAPTGAPALYGLVHMKNLALGVLPLDAEGCTLLVGQERFPLGRYSWELPEGGGDAERPPIEGAIRELSEEVGLKAAHWHALLEDVHLSNSVTDERAYAFLAWGLSPCGAFQKDASEDIVVHRVPFPRALDMALAGEITDVFTLAMLMKAAHLARRGELPAEVCQLLRG